MEREKLISEIKRLKHEKNAVILAHNYQLDEIQEIADFTGDSLELAKVAATTESDVIVFCGVRFMAETAHILNPSKVVLIPRIDAGCPMADTISADDVKELKTKYPDYSFVAYVNTNADVKAEIDVCCTSANAMSVVKNLSNNKIVFLPDKNLGNYVRINVPDKEIVTWNGCCNVHDRITLEEVKKAKEAHPDAELIVHPECRPEVVEMADKVLSTGGMVKYVKTSLYSKILIGTEEGMIHRLRREAPSKIFLSVSKAFVCPNMKKTRLEDLYISLLENKTEIILSEEMRLKAKRSLDEMLKYLGE